MLHRTLFLVDLRTTDGIDHNWERCEACLPSIVDFFELLTELDRRGLVRNGSHLETVALSILVSDRGENRTRVINILRATRPRNIKTKQMWAKIKQVIIALTRSWKKHALSIHCEFEWLERALNLHKAPPSGELTVFAESPSPKALH